MSATCPICGAPEASPASLVEHLRVAHPSTDLAADIDQNPEAHTPGVVCAHCGRRFRSPRELARHNLGPEPRERRVPATA